jgi:hypothetical protein
MNEKYSFSGLEPCTDLEISIVISLPVSLGIRRYEIENFSVLYIMHRHFVLGIFFGLDPENRWSSFVAP